MTKSVPYLVLVALAVAIGAQASNPKPAEVIAYRQSLFKTIGWNFGMMGAMVKGNRPWNPAEFKRRSIAVAFAAVQLDEAFPAGSDRGAMTDALPAIWEEPEEFAAKLDAFRKTANALRLAAAEGDERRIKAAFGDLRKVCADCHQRFRAD